MSARRQLGKVAILCACALALAGISLTPPLRQLDRLDIDLLHGLDHLLGRGSARSEPSGVAVIAIDEATHAAKPFAGLPKVMWTPHIARVQDALLSGGATVVGWDLILPTSASTYVADRKFDVPLLKSLSAASKQDRVVLGMASFAGSTIAPHGLFAWSAGGSANVRSVNIAPDPGGVLRHMPTFHRIAADGGEAWQTSMATELAARGSGRDAQRTGNGGLLLGGEPVPGVTRDRLTVNLARSLPHIPTFSFADLYACAEAGNADFFRENFAGRAVLIGLVLDIEDRKLAANRFFTDGGIPGPAPGCMTGASPADSAGAPRSGAVRSTVPGVYLHAAAIDNMLRGEALRSLPAPRPAAMTGAMALLAGAATLWLPLSLAAAVTMGFAAVWTGIAIRFFGDALLLPLSAPLLAALAAFMIMLAIRFAWLDRQGRFLRRAFASYVAPAIVDQLVAHPEQLKLGGERRDMSFLFTDLAGFTSMVEKVEPEQAVSLLNRYLDHMIEIARQNGGTIDKVIGDAVVVLFSAPVNQVNHAERAIACALEMDRFAQGFAGDVRATGVSFGVTRIGVHSGTAIVGNFGGSGFFDYTALGDAMNTAARLESANKQFGTRLTVSGETVRRCKAFQGRKIGKVVLKGKSLPVAVYEPLSTDAARLEDMERYDAAYEMMAERKPGARKAFEALAKERPGDGLVRFHLARLKTGTQGEVIELTEK